MEFGVWFGLGVGVRAGLGLGSAFTRGWGLGEGHRPSHLLLFPELYQSEAIPTEHAGGGAE